MLVEKEVISPGTIWYNDLKTGEPRKAIVTADHIKHWCEAGNLMLSQGLTVPVPCEHDFEAHPMTPADKLKANAGWVKDYSIKDGKLFSNLDILDTKIAEKLPTTIKWTSPWFSSFTDGNGKKWDNVIAHMALTTRPRLINQAPFPSMAAAIEATVVTPLPEDGFAASLAGLLKDEKTPQYPLAFSLYSGIALSKEEIEVIEKEKPKEGDKNALLDTVAEDMPMEKLLCDLLSLLGVPMPETASKADFTRILYQATMLKIKELSAKPPAPVVPPGAPPPKKPHNPIVQEQQPMYMSLEDINKIPDETMKNIALSMYNENVKMRNELEASNKASASLRDAKLAEETAKRKMRIDRLSRISPKVKVELEAMLALPGMALSLGDSGTIIDPLGSMLSVLEKGLSDIPAMLTTSSITEQPQPTDGQMTEEASNALADSFARQMGCSPEKKVA